jgi:hypothetical protein
MIGAAIASTTFPNPGFESGEYSLDWRLSNDVRIAGEVVLAGRRLPTLNAYGQLADAPPSEAPWVS